jgi:predicted alpha-1,2-mannosidase
MRPRNRHGTWLKECEGEAELAITRHGHIYTDCWDPLAVPDLKFRHYTEANAWQYLWYVPHDVEGLIRFGGNEKFTEKLDRLFAMSSEIKTVESFLDASGRIGQYVHGNEPSHHIAYLFAYAGQPWKTQYWVRSIMNGLYKAAPDGLAGNDDMGQMSAWYLFSGLGFYPVAPGQLIYVIGSPRFERITLHLGPFYEEKTFRVEAHNVSDENLYIQSVSLNGEPVDRTWIRHSEIVQGGILSFTMGPTPNEKWGGSPDAAPPSMTPGR